MLLKNKRTGNERLREVPDLYFLLEQTSYAYLRQYWKTASPARHACLLPKPSWSIRNEGYWVTIQDTIRSRGHGIDT